MQRSLTYQQKLQNWQELEKSSLQAIVVALHALDIHTVEASEGCPDKELLFPYVKVAIPAYDQAAQQVEQADKEAKQAHNLLSRFQIADESRKAELQAKIPSHEEVIRLAQVATDMRHALLEQHQPMLNLLFSYLASFYKDRIVSFDRYLVVTKNGFGRIILRSQGAILQACRTPEEQAIHLREYQSEMQEFAEFLKKIYFSS